MTATPAAPGSDPATDPGHPAWLPTAAENAAAGLHVFGYQPPRDMAETVSLANANGYEWGYLDTCRQHSVQATRVPDGWAFAWLEYVRRNGSRMAIREGFRHWQRYGTLPGLTPAH